MLQNYVATCHHLHHLPLVLLNVCLHPHIILLQQLVGCLSVALLMFLLFWLIYFQRLLFYRIYRINANRKEMSASTAASSLCIIMLKRKFIYSLSISHLISPLQPKPLLPSHHDNDNDDHHYYHDYHHHYTFIIDFTTVYTVYLFTTMMMTTPPPPLPPAPSPPPHRHDHLNVIDYEVSPKAGCSKSQPTGSKWTNRIPIETNCHPEAKRKTITIYWGHEIELSCAFLGYSSTTSSDQFRNSSGFHQSLPEHRAFTTAKTNS